MNRHARALRAGWVLDPESSRATRRNRLTLRLLETAGVHREWVCQDWHTPGIHTDQCHVDFDEWVTDEMLTEAWRLADLLITESGRWHRQQAAKENR